MSVPTVPGVAESQQNSHTLFYLQQAIQYVAEHGEVCPAGWKPGDKTMVADPEKSLDYFATVGETNKASG